MLALGCALSSPMRCRLCSPAAPRPVPGPGLPPSSPPPPEHRTALVFLPNNREPRWCLPRDEAGPEQPGRPPLMALHHPGSAPALMPPKQAWWWGNALRGRERSRGTMPCKGWPWANGRERRANGREPWDNAMTSFTLPDLQISYSGAPALRHSALLSPVIKI